MVPTKQKLDEWIAWLEDTVDPDTTLDEYGEDLLSYLKTLRVFEEVQQTLAKSWLGL